MCWFVGWCGGSLARRSRPGGLPLRPEESEFAIRGIVLLYRNARPACGGSRREFGRRRGEEHPFRGLEGWGVLGPLVRTMGVRAQMVM